MIIELESITREVKAVTAKLRPDEIDLDVEGSSLISDVALSGETERVDGKAHFRGKIDAEVVRECTRCLESVPKALSIEFDDAFVGADDEPTEEDLEAEDLDESIAIDGKIDVAEVVREQIILALPEQVFCRDDCKGLCPKCGENRNLIDCSCDDTEVDPRWAALANLN